MKDLPVSIATEKLEIFDVEIIVHVLDNGQRVIEESSLVEFFSALETNQLSGEQAKMVAEFLKK